MRHLIKNFNALATTALRRDALGILEAGLRAVETGPAVRRLVKRQGDRLSVGKRRYDLRRYKNVYVVALGKAGFDASVELERILGPRLTDGVVIDVKGGPLTRLSSRVGTHPFPSLQNMKATGEILALLKHVETEDLVLVVVSGGGSALLCWPTELTCTDLTLLTKAMMAKGATIQEMNVVRKHVSDIQGGQLAVLAYPAEVVGLIFSDVPGDDLSMVASGPTFLDDSTVEDAQAILDRYGLLKACRLPSCKLTETPKEAKMFRKVSNVLAVSGKWAVEAMRREGRRRGYRVRILSTALTGEAREVGKRLAASVKPGELLLACGETTVTLSKKPGIGGRNQTLALGALAHVPADGLVLACASDGVDHSPAAGAIADEVTREKAARRGLKPEAFLARNDEFPFFSAAKQHLLTGITGMNVSDLMIAIRRKR